MRFEPYNAIGEREDLETAVKRCNRKCFPFTHPLGLANLLADYAFILMFLKLEDRFEIAYLKDMSKEVPSGKVRVMLRHDVDHDILTATHMSRMEKAFGIPSSYYILHTSSYFYGTFDDDGVFHRWEALAPLYLELQNNGAEVGLHVDAFTLFKQGFDGFEAVKTELAWFRNIGLNVHGTTAHGSAPYYGAENFEIFREHRINKQDTITLNGSEVPLGALSEEELGLDYEGNFAKPCEETNPEKVSEYFSDTLEDDLKEHFRRYLHNNPYSRWGQDYTIWVYGYNLWAVASTDSTGTYLFDVSTRDVLGFLQKISVGSKVVLHIHPCYFGFRLFEGATPYHSLVPEINAFLPGAEQVKDSMQELVEAMTKKEDRLREIERAMAKKEDRLREIERVMAEKEDRLREIEKLITRVKKNPLGRLFF